MPKELHGVTPMEWQRGSFVIADCRERMDNAFIHHFLSTESYWARQIPLAVVTRSLDHSLCFGLFDGATQIGFGRVVSDRATFAYLTDVFVLASYRGQGLGQWLVEYMLSHPDLQGLRRWLLGTADAHELYNDLGLQPFSALSDGWKFIYQIATPLNPDSCWGRCDRAPVAGRMGRA